MGLKSSSRKTGEAMAGSHDYSAVNKGADKEFEQIDTLFQKYADKYSPDVIGPETIERLFMDLGVKITDVKVLMLAWKMQAARQGYFTLEEWHRGLKSLKVDTIYKLKNALPTLQQEVMSPQSFPDFYTYSFQYCLTEEREKYLDMESACELLKIVLGNRNPAQVESLLEFLENQKECKSIILDQWQSFLRFFDEGKGWLQRIEEFISLIKCMIICAVFIFLVMKMKNASYHDYISFGISSPLSELH